MAGLEKVGFWVFLLLFIHSCDHIEICDGETCLCVPTYLNILDKFLISPLSSGEGHQGVR